MKAQVSIELISLIAILLIIFAFVLASAMEKNRLAENMKIYLEKKRDCERFANDVGAVFILGDGASSTIELNNNLSVINNTAYSENIFCNLCCNVTRNGQSSFNLTKGSVTIINANGDIIV